MAKIDGDDRELNERDAALVKGMLSRGDKQHHIAAYFGVDSRAVSHVSQRKTFADVNEAQSSVLPPPGPYRLDPSYTTLYQSLLKINTLWENRDLRSAKALLESVLKQPLMPIEQTSIDRTANDLFRDDFGIITY